MAKIETIITDHLDVWSSAIKQRNSQGRGSSKKQELYGIQKLRELILELAVRGLLVPQDPKDEPASVLVEKIASEKKRLIAEKVIKNSKPLTSIDDSEKAFSLPENWKWERLGNTGIGATGKTPNTKLSEYFDGSIPFIGPGEITPSGNLLDSDRLLTDEGIKHSTEAVVGDILMVCIGGSIGKSVIADKNLAFNQQINRLRPLFIIPEYLNTAMSSNVFYRMLINKATGSATPIINRTKWEELLVPVPPLLEQKRIVEKVDELMALCNQLEQQQENSITAHQQLVEVLLAALTQATDAEAFQQAWTHPATNFETLFTTENSIEQLKQTLLQLAVMGKLVPQDPNDEPASVLLEKIAAEKEKLIANKGIKRQKNLSIINDEDKTFDVPSSWVWAKFSDIAFKITDGAHHTPRYVESGVPFLSVKDMSDGNLSFEDTRFISEEQHNELIRRCNPEKGDLLLTKVGTTGVPVLIDTAKSFSIFVSVALIKFSQSNIDGKYLELLVKSPFVKKQSEDGTQGVGNKNLVLRTISGFNLVFPPLAEQKRIVEKVDQLFAICDQLKEKIRTAEETQLQLADALTNQAIQ